MPGKGARRTRTPGQHAPPLFPHAQPVCALLAPRGAAPNKLSQLPPLSRIYRRNTHPLSQLSPWVSVRLKLYDDSQSEAVATALFFIQTCFFIGARSLRNHWRLQRERNAPRQPRCPVALLTRCSPAATRSRQVRFLVEA